MINILIILNVATFFALLVVVAGPMSSRPLREKLLVFLFAWGTLGTALCLFAMGLYEADLDPISIAILQGMGEACSAITKISIFVGCVYVSWRYSQSRAKLKATESESKHHILV